MPPQTAIALAPPQTPSDLRVKRLKREVVPFSSADIHRGSVAWVENPDPVLRYVAMKGEEEYRVMERAEPSIRSAKRKRVNTALSFGSKVIPGDNSKDALELRDWTVQFMKRIPKFHTVQRLAYDGIFWGWRPIEVTWDTEFQFKGKRFWGISAMREKMPEKFRFTPDRDLMYLRDGGADPVIFDRPEDSLKWMICTAGSTDNPYGEAEYRAIWLIYYIKQQFIQMWAQGMKRSLGLIKVKQGADPGSALMGAGASKKLSEIALETREMLQSLDQSGVIVEKYGWALEVVSDIQFADGWKSPIAYCDEVIQLAMTGETLTMRLGDVGSRAAAQIHRDGLLDYCKTDMREQESWWNDGVIAPAIKLNFGDNIPDELFPKWRSKIHRIVDVANIQALFNMGAPIDGEEAADDLNVALALEGTPSKLILQKPDPMELLEAKAAAMPAGGAGSSGGAANEKKPKDPDKAGKNPPAKASRTLSDLQSELFGLAESLDVQ
jgi:phage gp29-like protein